MVGRTQHYEGCACPAQQGAEPQQHLLSQQEYETEGDVRTISKTPSHNCSPNILFYMELDSSMWGSGRRNGGVGEGR